MKILYTHITEKMPYLGFLYINGIMPEAKKPYNLKSVHQPVLDIHGIASTAEIIAVNEPRTLKVIVPALEAGKAYTLKIVTQMSAKTHSHLLKEVRIVQSDFTLTAQV